MVEVEQGTASNIASVLLHTLENHGLSENFLQDHLVAFASDGASVMLGKKAGVAKLLLDQFPRLIVWHCVAHRLELSLHDSLHEVSGTNNFKHFIDKLYTVYHASPKNRNQLQECARELDVQLATIGRLLDTRWVASSNRTLKAVWQSYSALHAHFLSASEDKSRDSKDRSCYRGLLSNLTSEAFILNIGAMRDALQELSELSLELQKRTLTINEAHRAILRQIKVFEEMIDKDGTYVSTAKQAVKDGSFKGVPLRAAGKNEPVINSNQLFRSLAENMKQRLLVCQSSHTSRAPSSASVSATEYNILVDCVKVLYPAYWPDVVDVRFGEDEISQLATRFGVNVRSAVRAFRSFVETQGTVIEDDLKPLFSAIAAVPVSTSECERGFSCMNLLLTSARNSLYITTLSI